MMTMTTAPTEATISTTADRRQGFAIAVRVGWFLGWLFLTVFAWFEVIDHGYVNGDAVDAVVLTMVAVGAFVLPDLTFLIGVGQQVERGYLPVRAVPFYNAMHRFGPPLLLTTFIGVVVRPHGAIGPALLVGGVSWMAHIAMDRAAGYGLRNADGSR